MNRHENKSEFYHFGIPGMKWGIRRYQNKDGSLTPEGEERYGTSLEKYRSREVKRLEKQSSKFDKKIAKNEGINDEKTEKVKRGKDYVQKEIGGLKNVIQ